VTEAPGGGELVSAGASAPARFPRPGKWQRATVTEIRPETPTAKTFRLALTEPSPYLAGQHYIVRLTAPDGYTASRSYSVASAPDDSGEIELTVEQLPEGEVSSFLHDVVMVGDELQVRGPIGGWFVWPGDTPAVLIGGGSGVVPLMAMLRLARRTGRPDLVHLVVSVREPGRLYYAGELPGPQTTIVYTRRTPPSWPRPAGRLRPGDLPTPLPANAAGYICGSSGFADAATTVLREAGMPVERIKVERFGPTG
jgi:ferredoxin-NADP reductase